MRYNSRRYDCRESGLYIRRSPGAPSTLPDLPEHAENHAGMAQRFLRGAIEKNREQNQKNDRSLAGESSMESLSCGGSDLRFCSPMPGSQSMARKTLVWSQSEHQRGSREPQVCLRQVNVPNTQQARRTDGRRSSGAGAGGMGRWLELRWSRLGVLCSYILVNTIMELRVRGSEKWIRTRLPVEAMGLGRPGVSRDEMGWPIPIDTEDR